MFDTTVFNHILVGSIGIVSINRRGVCFVTHVQRDELSNTSDAGRREQLLSVFAQVDKESLPTETALWDFSKWDEAKWSAEDELFNELLKALDAKKKKPNNRKDALIAETAIKQNLVLVTDDAVLRRVVQESSGCAQSLEDFLHGDLAPAPDTSYACSARPVVKKITSASRD